ncbi:MAG TPA: glycosyl transferase family 1, partial [Bacillota bacterium]|nr:glycosyl transferase family 1 [Bacillota bacterium]
SAVLPEIRLDHLKTLTDDTGIFQHALYTVPDRRHGYCTDDNARALLVTVMNWRLFKEERILPFFRTYLSFLLYAYNRERERMRNFMSYQRQWLEEIGSEDSHGRSIWALGYTVAYPPDDSLIGLVTRLFKQCLLQAPSFTSPRAWAFTIIGVIHYLKRFGGDPEARQLLEELSRRLCRQFSEYATAEWFWLEEIVTYDNARIPQALIAAGRYLHDEQILQTGLGALDWLISIQTDPGGGQLSLVGNKGWYRRGGQKARFDQQPLDAAALVDACAQAYLVTGEPRWQIAMDWAFNWFFGNNDIHQPLYDFSSGGCCDGLMPGGVNLNQGAESTLSLMLALHRMHLASHQGYTGIGEVAGAASPQRENS